MTKPGPQLLSGKKGRQVTVVVGPGLSLKQHHIMHMDCWPPGLPHAFSQTAFHRVAWIEKIPRILLTVSPFTLKFPHICKCSQFVN